MIVKLETIEFVNLGDGTYLASTRYNKDLYKCKQVEINGVLYDLLKEPTPDQSFTGWRLNIFVTKSIV